MTSNFLQDAESMADSYTVAQETGTNLVLNDIFMYEFNEKVFQYAPFLKNTAYFNELGLEIMLKGVSINKSRDGKYHEQAKSRCIKFPVLAM